MRNPNNELIPNLYSTDTDSCEAWAKKVLNMEVAKYLDKPLEYVGHGLTFSEARFLDNTKQTVEYVLGRKVGYKSFRVEWTSSRIQGMGYTTVPNVADQQMAVEQVKSQYIALFQPLHFARQNFRIIQVSEV